MERFITGQRVFDKDCGELELFLQYISKNTVAVEYDHNWGCDSSVCEVHTGDLEPA